jgi:hypothetical protein
MFSLFGFLQARWRWAHGRCPRCNRNLHSTFAYYVAAYPDCPVCKEETKTDLRVWHAYRTLRTDKKLAVAGTKE